VLENYFEPTDTRFSKAQQKIEEIFRVTTRRDVNLGDEGKGIRQVVPVQGGLPNPEMIREMELFQGTPAPGEGVRWKTRQELGMPPLKKIYLNPARLKEAKLYWYIDVDTKEKETSNVEKLMFREELADMALLMRMGARPNLEALQSQHALVWNRPKDKLFKAPVDPAMLAQQGAATVGGRGGQTGSPTQSPPIPNAPAGVGQLPA
jgi:hypothetical protein